MKTIPVKTRIYKVSENLFDFIIEHISQLEERSVLVITSKIVALAENRVVTILTDDEKEQVIKQNSDYAYNHPYGWLTIVDGLMAGSAGLDASNIEGNVYSLLPKDSFNTAISLRKKLMDHFSLKELGIIITDSRLMPLRKGTLGAAFGYAGIKALRDYTESTDIYGRPYERQKANIPDALATAAVLEMGEGAEMQPLALITEATITFTNETIDKNELIVPVTDDIYYFFYRDYNGN